MPVEHHPHASALSHLRHELRTPINAIIGYSEMLLEELETENSIEGFGELQQIREYGLQLTSLVNTLLGNHKLETYEFDLKQLLEDPTVKNQLQIITNLVFEYCQQLLQSTSKTSLISDIKKISQASQSLLTITCSMVSISEEKVINNTALENYNLSQTSQETLINNHYSSSNYDTISKEINNTKDTILVVDDNETNCDLLSRYITSQGYQVVIAMDGKQALEMIQIQQYDLILLDIVMPEIDGYEVLKWIRHSSLRHIPVIMISALDEIDSVVKCIEMGAEDYLSKPFNPVILKARINACLQQKKLRDQEDLYLSQLAQANQEITTLNERLKAENNRLSSELEVTQKLQRMILPKEKELSQIDDLEIAGFMEPADEVGGDYYDVLHHNGKVKIGIGDVTGHGLESGVLMLMVQTAVRTLMESNETDPKKFLEILNRTIYKNIQRMDCDKNLTLCLVDYHDYNLILSGQHEEIVVVNYQGEIRRIDTIDLGFPIGLEETIADFVFQVEIQLNVGDIVILYTDGISEAENSSGEQYGLDRLCQIVKENNQKSAKEIRHLVIDDLHKYIGDHKIYDDITLVIIKQR